MYVELRADVCLLLLNCVSLFRMCELHIYRVINGIVHQFTPITPETRGGSMGGFRGKASYKSWSILLPRKSSATKQTKPNVTGEGKGPDG